MSAAGQTRGAVVGVLLAAGRASRFGSDRPKQLLDFHGEPLVRRTARQATASRLDHLVAVVGYRHEEVAEALSGLDLEIVVNRAWESGLASSVKAGLTAARRGDEPAAVLFVPADQPLLDTASVDRILDAWAGRDPAIVRPRFGHRFGAPVLWSRSLFDELETLDGESGGRQLIARHAEIVQEVGLASETPLLDADEPGQLRALLELADGR